MRHNPMQARQRPFVSISLLFLAIVLALAFGLPASLAYAADEAAMPETQEATTEQVETSEVADYDLQSTDEMYGISAASVRNTTNVTFTLTDLASLKQADTVDSIAVKATMSYDGQVTRSIEQTILLSDIDTSTGSFSVDFADFGKFSVEVSFLNGSTSVHTNEPVTVGVTADEYNIAMVSATLPVTFLSLDMWGDGNMREDGPTILLLERSNSYNWDELPQASDGLYGAYGLPYLTRDEISYQPSDINMYIQQFTGRFQIMFDYVSDLVELDSNARIHLWCADMYCGLAQDVIYANNVAEGNYKITLLSDGSYTASEFGSVYNSSDNSAKHAELVSAWKKAKQNAYANGSVDSGFSGYAAKDYFWALVDSEDNAELWVARKDLLKSTGDEDAFGTTARENAKLVQASIATMLSSNIQASEQNANEFKALYNFNDGFFSDAEESGKSIMLFLGTRVTNEKNFAEYARFVMSYYGDDYAYYYKGHPATPTDLYPEKQEELNQLGITDVDASIAAEIILFFNPEIYLSGYSSTTYQSVPEGMAKGMFNMTKATGTADDLYKNMDYWMSQVDDATSEAVLALCTSDHDNYLVEFSDDVAAESGYDIAIWDATDSLIIYYKLENDGSYTKVSEQEGMTAGSAVESGTYVIQSSLEDGKVLNVSDGSAESGANVELGSYAETDAQRWKVEVDESTGLATITNVGSGLLLTVSGGQATSGANVCQASADGSTAQQWRIVSTGSGAAKVVSALNSNYVLDINGSNSADGTNAQLWLANGGAAQSFLFLNVEPSVSVDDQADLADGYYTITSALNTNKALDVSNGDSSDGVALQLWESSGAANQVFQITKLRSGFYRIENAWTGKSLEVEGDSIIPGSVIQQATNDFVDSGQEWAIVKKSGGSYTLQNVATGLMLEVAGNSAANGSSVVGDVARAQQGQRWLIAQVDGPGSDPTPASAEMYRLYNQNSGEHFYTASIDERINLVDAGWTYEGIGWTAPTSSNTPVYRLYNPYPDPTTGSGEHHFTMSEEERDTLVAAGWQYEGIGWYSDDDEGTPLYRQYNPNAFNCNHNYTTSKDENDWLVSLGWRDEGIAWYGLA